MAAVFTGAFCLKKKFIVSLLAVFAFLVHDASDDVGADRVSVSAMKGDSVTLHTNIIINQPDRVKWYFSGTRIAQITGDLSDICTDVQCNEGNERFRDRLKLDNQTADLTITNTSDNGVYHLKIFSSRHTGKDFDVVVHDVPAAGMKRKAVTEGDSVTLDAPEEKKPNDVMAWFFNDTLIAEITGDQSKIFRDRLELDNQTGSLMITNTRTTDAGLYHLQIKSSRNRYSTTSIKSFTVSVTDSGLSSAAVAGICAAAAVLLVFAAVGVIYYHCRSSIKDEGSPHDRRGSQHRAGTNRVHLQTQMSYCAPTFHPLPESESETE
ncbi:uncharacterized protein [Sinocyclocheilus grahami]|uniref:uncharacterized protein n=1 Tax=Sinocyclocheilus grahami TaxID=75366 RepID=UPI0007AD55EC|nr:PREDICTED: uncharacterized protein LOC107591190 [Sinocyclocheilus grahami]